MKSHGGSDCPFEVVVFKCVSLMFRFISREGFGGLDNEDKVKSSYVSYK